MWIFLHYSQYTLKGQVSLLCYKSTRRYLQHVLIIYTSLKYNIDILVYIVACYMFLLVFFALETYSLKYICVLRFKRFPQFQIYCLICLFFSRTFYRKTYCTLRVIDRRLQQLYLSGIILSTIRSDRKGLKILNN